MFLDRYYLSGKGTTLFKEGFKILKKEFVEKNSELVAQAVCNVMYKEKEGWELVEKVMSIF